MSQKLKEPAKGGHSQNVEQVFAICMVFGSCVSSDLGCSDIWTRHSTLMSAMIPCVRSDGSLTQSHCANSLSCFELGNWGETMNHVDRMLPMTGEAVTADCRGSFSRASRASRESELLITPSGAGGGMGGYCFTVGISSSGAPPGGGEVPPILASRALVFRVFRRTRRDFVKLAVHTALGCGTELCCGEKERAARRLLSSLWLRSRCFREDFTDRDYRRCRDFH